MLLPWSENIQAQTVKQSFVNTELQYNPSVQEVKINPEGLG